MEQSKIIDTTETYHLTISTRPRNKKKVIGEEAARQEEWSAVRRRHCKKKGRWRGGCTTRIRVAGEEAELPVSSSEGLNLESKEE